MGTPAASQKSELNNDRERLGRMLKATEAIAPTHLHPKVAGHEVAMVATLPVASIIDRARDALSRAS